LSPAASSLLSAACGTIRTPDASCRNWPRPTIHEVIQGNYRIVYRVTTDRLEILAIVHGARELPTSSF
jgi:plasmid stabilization system protein ParE